MDEDISSSAVILGKLEVMVGQLLQHNAEQREWWEEVWRRLRELESFRAAQEGIAAERGRRPSWVSITMMVVGIISLAATLGIIGTKV